MKRFASVMVLAAAAACAQGAASSPPPTPPASPPTSPVPAATSAAPPAPSSTPLAASPARPAAVDEPQVTGAEPQAAVVQQPQVSDKRFSVTLTPTERGRYSLSVQNLGRLAILAWAVDATDSSSSSAAQASVHIFFDTAVNYPQDQPLQPGGTMMKALPGRIGAGQGSANVAMRAVIFADGSTAGDPGWIDKILARRRRMYIAINTIEEAIRNGVNREERIDQITSEVTRERVAARQQTDDADINAATDRVYSAATGLLNSTKKLNDATTAIWNLYEPWRGALRSSVPAQAMD